MNGETRATFAGRISAVLVAAGSAVGLGNIWRFPYLAGENGGGAFLVIYLVAILLIGLPLMLSEFAIGTATHRNAVGAFRALDKRWVPLGYMGVLSSVLILGFYLVVAGWTAEYMIHSPFSSQVTNPDPQSHVLAFENFVANPWKPVLYAVGFGLATHLIIALGVQKGIERAAKWMMPLLFVAMALFSVVQLFAVGRTYPNFLAVRAISTLTGLALIPILFYTYTGVLGSSVSWANIAIFYVSALTAFLLDFRLLRKGRFSSPWQQLLGLLVLWGLAFCFVWCTFRPPRLGLWKDPLTGMYGI